MQTGMVHPSEVVMDDGSRMAFSNERVLELLLPKHDMIIAVSSTLSVPP